MNKLTESEKQRYKNDWFQQNAPIGKELGYPACCIKEFCDLPPELMNGRIVTEVDRMKLKAAYIGKLFTGFIPCAEHAKQIIEGKITLASLIKDRSIFFPPFPNHQL
jgi:hypothetical protein